MAEPVFATHEQGPESGLCSGLTARRRDVAAFTRDSDRAVRGAKRIVVTEQDLRQRRGITWCIMVSCRCVARILPRFADWAQMALQGDLQRTVSEQMGSAGGKKTARRLVVIMEGGSDHPFAGQPTQANGAPGGDRRGHEGEHV